MRNLQDVFWIVVLFVLSLVGGAWSACEHFSYGYVTTVSGRDGCRYGNTCNPSTCQQSPQCQAVSNGCPAVVQNGNRFYYGATIQVPTECTATSTGCVSTGGNAVRCFYYDFCNSQTEADSSACLNSGNLWINGVCCDEQCVCQNSGGNWNSSTNTCEAPCNEHTNPHKKCEMLWDRGYVTELGSDAEGGGYWKIQIYDCYYDSCAMSLNCTEESSFPAGNLTCDDWQDTTSSDQNCVAVIGHQCTIQCPNNVTISCDCDGSCDAARRIESCQCPTPSPPNSSSSADSSSASEISSSSADSSSASEISSSSADGSSASGGGATDAMLGAIEYNTRRTYQSVEHYGNMSTGYLSSIDRWQSTLNMSIQQSANKIDESVASATAQAVTAQNATTDTIHNTNNILSDILGSLTDSVDFDFDISSWQTSADSTINALKNRDTTIVHVDSLKNDTAQFKSKYSSFFLTGVYTRDGCYEFTMKKPEQTSKFGRAFSSDISVNFGSLAGFFDLCAILRGITRIAGAILVILISIKSYRSAFSSEDG